MEDAEFDWGELDGLLDDPYLNGEMDDELPFDNGFNPVISPEVANTIELGKSSDDSKKTKEERKIYKITDEDIERNAYLLYPKTRTYTSLLLKHFTPERCIELEKLRRTLTISNNKKCEIIKDMLKEWGLAYHPLGPGTNRFGFMIDGYVCKVALDPDGKIDNKREFIYSKDLYPYVVKCYETLADGLLAVFEYVEMFNIDDFFRRQDQMRKILAKIAETFLIGDVGIDSKNYVNWGTRDDGSIAILDYAYIYSVAFKTFTCNCSAHSTLHFDRDFKYLICPTCQKKYSFKDIRKRISRKDQDKEIGDLNFKGYIISKKEEELNFNPKFVYGAESEIYHKLRKLRKKAQKKTEESVIRQTEDQAMDIFDIIKDINKEKKGDYHE